MKKPLHVGFAGTGLMGYPMCERLLDHGFKLSVWNRTREKLQGLVKKGAAAVDTPEALARACDVVCFCLLDAKAVEEVVFGEFGLAKGMRPSQILIDFSSIGPEATERMALRLQEDVQGVWIDAPVTGGVAGAKDGTLVILVGGNKESIDLVKPIFDAVGSKMTHLGPTGAGAATKICSQLIVGCNIILYAEMVALARKYGLDVSKLHDALNGGWADSRPFQIFVPRMAARTTEPKLGGLGNMMEDLNIVVEMAQSCGASVPITGMVAGLYQACAYHVESGLEADISSLINLYEGNNEG